MTLEPGRIGREFRQTALLGVPGLYAIGSLILDNLEGVSHIERLIVIWVALWLVAIGACSLLRRLGVNSKAAAYGVFLSTAAFVSFGGVARQLGTAAAVLLLVVVGVLVAWLTQRSGDWFAVDAVIVGLAVGMLAGPLTSSVRSVANYGESTLTDPASISVTMTKTPPIWLVVVDGYPGAATLERDLGIDRVNQVETRLIEEGFAVPVNAWSPYPQTKLAVSSIVEMDYVATDWTDNAATTQHLYNTISGENQLMRVLGANGYKTHMIEAGWSGSSCGANFDHCTSSPLFDEALNVLLHDSVLAELPFSSPGFSFTLGSKATMSGLLGLAESIDDHEMPTFVFAHILAPHPPLYLDSHCEVVIEPERGGFFYPLPSVSAAVRDRYFRAQLECVDDFLIELARSIHPEALVIYVSDHGTGRRAQMGQPSVAWSDDDVRERLNTMAAVRSQDDCQLGDPHLTVNLMRRVLSCLSDIELPDLPPRMFEAPGVEIEHHRVEALLR